MIFIEGIGTGLLMALIFGFGPAFFLIIQTTLNYGFKSGMQIALGISLNDFFIVSICLMSSIQMQFDDPQNELYAGIAACIILILFGIYTITHKSKAVMKTVQKTNDELAKMEEVTNKKPLWIVLIGKGFLMNIFNPFVWIYWLTLVASISGRFDRRIDSVVFFAGVLGAVLAGDILKSLGASSIKKIFTPKMIVTMNVIMGVVLICFGVFILLKVLFL